MTHSIKVFSCPRLRSCTSVLYCTTLQLLLFSWGIKCWFESSFLGVCMLIWWRVMGYVVMECTGGSDVQFCILEWPANCSERRVWVKESRKTRANICFPCKIVYWWVNHGQSRLSEYSNQLHLNRRIELHINMMCTYFMYCVFDALEISFGGFSTDPDCSVGYQRPVRILQISPSKMDFEVSVP